MTNDERWSLNYEALKVHVLETDHFPKSLCGIQELRNLGNQERLLMKNDERWSMNYEALRLWTLEHGHFPNRAKIEGRGLLNWYKYNAKLIKQGKLSPKVNR